MSRLPTIIGDLNMLVVTTGRERTEAEFRDLLAGAGFELSALVGPLDELHFHLIEGRPV